MVSCDAVKDINHRLGKGGTLAIGLIIEDLRLWSESCNKFKIHDRLALPRTGREVAVNINILNIRRSDTYTSSIACKVLGIVGITKLGHADGHALPLVPLLIKLIHLICRRKFVASKRLFCSVLATIAGKRCGISCGKTKRRLELRESKVIQANNRRDQRGNRLWKLRFTLLQKELVAINRICIEFDIQGSFDRSDRSMDFDRGVQSIG